MPERPVRVADRPAAERLVQQIEHQARRIEGPLPTERQVAMVLHALADHTAIMAALNYSRDYPSGSGIEDRHWPDATSVGRWLHAVADDLEYAAPDQT